MRLPKFSLKGLLLSIAVLCVAFGAGHEILQRLGFAYAKYRTIHGVPADCVEERESVLRAIDNKEYFDRNTPTLAFCGMYSSSSGLRTLFADWVVNQNNVNGFQIRFESGKVKNIPIIDTFGGQDGCMHFNGSVTNRDRGTESVVFDDIVSLSLTEDGVTVTEWKAIVIYDFVTEDGSLNFSRRK